MYCFMRSNRRHDASTMDDVDHRVKRQPTRQIKSLNNRDRMGPAHASRATFRGPVAKTAGVVGRAAYNPP